MKISKTTAFLLAIAGIGIWKYQRFLDFINNLRIEYHVKSSDEEKAILKLSAIDYLKIPYSIQNIELLSHDGSQILAKNTNTLENILSPLAMNSPSIQFKLLKNSSTEELQKGQLAITFSWFGLKLKRLYPNTTIVEIEDDSNTINAKCCCSKN